MGVPGDPGLPLSNRLNSLTKIEDAAPAHAVATIAPDHSQPAKALVAMSRPDIARESRAVAVTRLVSGDAPRLLRDNVPLGPLYLSIVVWSSHERAVGFARGAAQPRPTTRVPAIDGHSCACSSSDRG